MGAAIAAPIFPRKGNKMNIYEDMVNKKMYFDYMDKLDNAKTAEDRDKYAGKALEYAALIVEDQTEPLVESKSQEPDFPHSYVGIKQEVKDLVQHRITMALLLCKQNKSAAADLLRLPSYQTLTNWIKRYGVKHDNN